MTWRHLAPRARLLFYLQAFSRLLLFWLPTTVAMGAVAAATVLPLIWAVLTASAWFFLLFLGSIVNAPGWEQTLTIWDKIGALPGDAFGLSVGFGTFHLSALFLFAIAALEIYQWLDSRRPVFDRLEAAGAIVAWPFWWGLAAIILVFGVFTGSGFLYFDF